MRNGKKDEAEKIKAEVQEINNKLEENEALENKYAEEIKTKNDENTKYYARICSNRKR